MIVHTFDDMYDVFSRVITRDRVCRACISQCGLTRATTREGVSAR
jgi:hypothetical protein